MIPVKNMPVVRLCDIRDELMKKRGVKAKHVQRLHNIMFGDNFTTSVYATYDIDCDVCEEYYEDKEDAKIEQMVIDMLRDACPNADQVMINVAFGNA
jgi:hypothetical protein